MAITDPLPESTGTGYRARVVRALPWLWLGLSAVWAVVIFATDQMEWPLALWVATTVGPLIALRNRLGFSGDPAEGRS